MPTDALGAEVRRFENREHEGKPARVVIAVRRYDTGPEDLWDALTNRERIPRWFLPIEGDLRLGGRYQLKGNAGGTITRCEPQKALDITWEFGGVSWVRLRLEPEGARTRLTLEHIVHVSDTDEHWARFGPGAVGVGWELSLHGLGRHIAGGGAAVDRAAAASWMASEAGKAFMRSSAKAWAEAHRAAGEDPKVAAAMGERTAAAYTGG
jgi:uncharacterized protein YndB with AHSA1/START domain